MICRTLTPVLCLLIFCLNAAQVAAQCQPTPLAAGTGCDGLDNNCDTVIDGCSEDVTAPAIACPPDAQVPCETLQSGPPNPAQTGQAQANDDCSQVNLQFNDQLLPLLTGAVIVRHWQAVDGCGNASDCVQILLVVDILPPNIGCPPDTQVDCALSPTPALTGAATAQDNCDPAPYIDFSDNPVPGQFPGQVELFRTWTAVDGFGNGAECVQVITLTDCPLSCQDVDQDGYGVGDTSSCPNPGQEDCDDQNPAVNPAAPEVCDGVDNNCNGQVDETDGPPTVACPGDLSVECPGDVSPAVGGVATAADDCGGVEIVFLDSFAPGCGGTGALTRTWVAIDDRGQTAECVQMILVVDTTPPVLTCPANVALECPAADTGTGVTGVATAVDTCGPVVSIEHVDLAVIDCGSTLVLTRTWFANDACNNISQCLQTISVVDTTAPNIACPAGARIECPADVSVAARGQASGVDACGPVTISHSDAVTPDCGEARVITRTWTATDACQNKRVCNQLIEVVDTMPPMLACPSDVTVDCDDPTDPDSTGWAVATDACDPFPTVLYFDIVAGQLITRVWHAIDACNNETAGCEQLIWIRPCCELDYRTFGTPLMSGGLKPPSRAFTIPYGEPFVMSAEGLDFDLFRWTCTPDIVCEDEDGSTRYTVLTGKVSFDWQVTSGTGGFIEASVAGRAVALATVGQHVLFEPPTIAPNATVTTTVLLQIVDNNSSQPRDATVPRAITIAMTRKQVCDTAGDGTAFSDLLEVSITSPAYTLPTPPTLTPLTGECRADPPFWGLTDDLVAAIDSPFTSDVCTGEYVRLQATDFQDPDLLIVGCSSDNCDTEDDLLVFGDDVKWSWRIVSGGGMIVDGADGRVIVYRAPATPGEVELEVTVTNAGGLQIADSSKTARIKLKVAKLAFIDTELANDIDILPLFNPHPYVVLEDLPALGTGESLNVTVKGEVKDFVAPIEKVLVNGVEVAVTNLQVGTDGLGPFTAKFERTIALDGSNWLIQAQAINSLHNVGSDSIQVVVARNAGGTITGRTATAVNAVPTQPADEANYLDDFRFRIEVQDPGATGDEIEVAFSTGVVQETIKLKKVSGIIYRSDPLFLVPKNLMLPASASDRVKKSRLKSDLGKFPQAEYAHGRIVCSDQGLTQGILLLKKTDSTIADFAESGTEPDVTAATAARTYLVQVGLPGVLNGKEITVDLLGLDRSWALMGLTQPQPQASFPERRPAVVLKRQSDCENDPKFNLYEFEDPDKPLMAVRSPLPLDNAEAPVQNDNLIEVYSAFDGALYCAVRGRPLTLIEPIVGIEIVSVLWRTVSGTSRPTSPEVFEAAGLIPHGNPAPPILSVADGAPRPIVDITSTAFSGNNANPTRMRVRGTVRDYIADLVPGAATDADFLRLSAVGMRLFINGVEVTNGNANGTVTTMSLTVTRAGSGRVGGWVATFDAQINLQLIPNANDRLAYVRRPGIGVMGTRMKIAQEAVIVQAVNAIGNRGSDSSFVLLVENDPSPELQPPYEQTINPNLGTHYATDGTYAGWTPPRFYVLYHHPFQTAATFTQHLRSRFADDTLFADKTITIRRSGWGNYYRYGPFLAGNVDRNVTAVPAVADRIPIVPTIRYRRNGSGVLTNVDIGRQLEVTAPAASQIDRCLTPALDTRIGDTITGRDAFLPQGTDAAPTALNIISSLSPIRARSGLTLTHRLSMVTSFTGHTGNAPRAGAGGLGNNDFSFMRTGDSVGPTAARGFLNNGQQVTALFVKDWGGRTLIDTRLNLPGAPRILTELPMDSDGDFLPDAWEARFRLAGGADPNNPVRDGLEDLEDRTFNGGAVIHNEAGDGFTALEEYRGFQAQGVVRRMDELPLMFAMTYTGRAADGNLVAGPRVKDVFIQYQSTMNVESTNNGNNTSATIFNVGFHRVAVGDLAVDNRVGGVYTTWRGHNHQMNFNGNNDTLTTPQNCIHVRDDTNITQDFEPPAGPDLLGNRTLGNSGTFYFDGVDLRVNPNGEGVGGANPGRWRVGRNAAGNIVRVTMNEARRNSNTIMHEIGHKCSLRHSVDTTQYNGAIGASNGVDFLSLNPAGNVQLRVLDGNPDGHAIVTGVTFAVEGGVAANTYTRGLIWNDAPLVRAHLLGSEGAGLLDNGGAAANSQRYALQRDGFRNPRLVAFVISNAQYVGPMTFQQNIFAPSLLDGWDYPINNGENVQQVLSGPQFVTGNTHTQEIRVRTLE